MNLLMSKCRRH